MIDCIENEDGSFTISWDENDPLESVLNDWTEEDFIEVIRNYAEEILACKDFYSKNSSKSREESGETGNISEATEEDYQDFWEGDDISEQESDNIEELTEHFFQDNYIEATNEETFGKEGYPTKYDRLWEG